MQGLSSNKFKNYITRLFQIKVLVNSSENTKTILSKFNITPAEFLRPFGVMSENKKIKIKSINSKEKMIAEFSLDFYDLEEYHPPNKQMIDEVIKDVILKNSPDVIVKYVKYPILF